MAMLSVWEERHTLTPLSSTVTLDKRGHLQARVQKGMDCAFLCICVTRPVMQHVWQFVVVLLHMCSQDFTLPFW